MDATGETHIPDSGQQSLEPKVGCPEEQYVIILRRVQKDGGVRTLGGVCECPARAGPCERARRHGHQPLMRDSGDMPHTSRWRMRARWACAPGL